MSLTFMNIVSTIWNIGESKLSSVFYRYMQDWTGIIKRDEKGILEELSSF